MWSLIQSSSLCRPARTCGVGNPHRESITSKFCAETRGISPWSYGSFVSFKSAPPATVMHRRLGMAEIAASSMAERGDVLSIIREGGIFGGRIQDRKGG